MDKRALGEIGVFESGVISTEEIVFGEEIRDICRTNGCGNYNTTWACPPAVGTVEECRARCLGYEKALVFSAKYELEDSFDFEGMMEGHRAFKALCDRLYALAREEWGTFLLLSNESCVRCKTCAWPNGPCRHAERLFPSLEGFGIYVNRLAERAGMRYINGSDTVTYFGMLLFDLKDKGDSHD